MKTLIVTVSSLGAQTVKVLGNLKRTAPVLPNLRNLVLFGEGDTAGHIATLFLSPKLASIRISMQPSTSLLAFMKSINQQRLSLRSLGVNRRIMDRFSDAVSNLILAQPDLESIQLGVLGPNILAHIATLSKLRRLDLGCLRAQDIVPVVGSGLTHITEMYLNTECTVTIFDQFLSLCRPRGLQNLFLNLRFSEFSTASEWQHFFQTLSRYCSTALKILNINQGDNQLIEHAAFLPLLAFRNLTHLSMSCVYSDLDNARLSQMAQAWPHLEVLVLRSPLSGPVATRVTLEGFLPLLEYCPKLKELALKIDATREPHCLHPRGVSNPNITTLTVGKSVIASPLHVARFFSYIFPNLKKIVFWEDVDPDIFHHGDCEAGEIHRSRWQKVLPMMQNMKAERLRGSHIDEKPCCGL
jgi:hypothetical protein